MNIEAAAAPSGDSAAGVRYLRAASRVEALTLLGAEFPSIRPTALIEVPGNMSAAKYGPC